MRKIPLVSLFLFFFVALVNLPCVFANDDINFLELPEKVGEAFFNGNTFAGGLVCSFILMMFFLLPTLFLIRNQSSMVALSAIMLVGSMVLCVCVAINWFAPWVLIFVVFTDIAFIAFGGINKWLGGSSRD